MAAAAFVARVCASPTPRASAPAGSSACLAFALHACSTPTLGWARTCTAPVLLPPAPTPLTCGWRRRGTAPAPPSPRPPATTPRRVQGTRPLPPCQAAAGASRRIAASCRSADRLEGKHLGGLRLGALRQRRADRVQVLPGRQHAGPVCGQCVITRRHLLRARMLRYRSPSYCAGGNYCVLKGSWQGMGKGCTSARKEGERLKQAAKSRKENRVWVEAARRRRRHRRVGRPFAAGRRFPQTASAPNSERRQAGPWESWAGRGVGSAMVVGQVRARPGRQLASRAGKKEKEGGRVACNQAQGFDGRLGVSVFLMAASLNSLAEAEGLQQ